MRQPAVPAMNARLLDIEGDDLPVSSIGEINANVTTNPLQTTGLRQPVIAV